MNDVFYTDTSFSVRDALVAALEQLAGQGETGAVTADPLCGLQVVRAVGAGREPGALRGFIQRPAQRGRALAGEMPTRAVLVRLVDGDVQPRGANASREF